VTGAAIRAVTRGQDTFVKFKSAAENSAMTEIVIGDAVVESIERVTRVQQIAE
jgi:hypothetical protein